jgi:hypothetical protein
MPRASPLPTNRGRMPSITTSCWNEHAEQEREDDYRSGIRCHGNVGFRRPDGEWCIGINSMQLARALGIDVEQIFEANRNRTLILDATDTISGTHGTSQITRYRFRIGDRTADAEIELGMPFGRA